MSEKAWSATVPELSDQRRPAWIASANATTASTAASKRGEWNRSKACWPPGSSRYRTSGPAPARAVTQAPQVPGRSAERGADHESERHGTLLSRAKAGSIAAAVRTKTH
jgi:hypothetical protein